MTAAPRPSVLADHLERVAAHLRKRGDKTTELAELFAARGFPTNVGGAGARSSDSTSSVEREAIDAHSEWHDIDDLEAQLRRALWKAALDWQAIEAKLWSHASDDDPIPIGRGACQACGKFCKGDGGNDRLRSGFCNNCTQRWRRYRIAYPWATRSDFVTDTKREQRATGT